MKNDDISNFKIIHLVYFNKRYKNIFNTLELEENSVVKKYLTTASDNKKYNTNYYNLDAVISIRFRVNSDKAIQFRRWSINVLKKFSKKRVYN